MDAEKKSSYNICMVLNHNAVKMLHNYIDEIFKSEKQIPQSTRDSDYITTLKLVNGNRVCKKTLSDGILYFFKDIDWTGKECTYLSNFFVDFYDLKEDGYPNAEYLIVEQNNEFPDDYFESGSFQSENLKITMENVFRFEDILEGKTCYDNQLKTFNF